LHPWILFQQKHHSKWRQGRCFPLKARGAQWAASRIKDEVKETPNGDEVGPGAAPLSSKDHIYHAVKRKTNAGDFSLSLYLFRTCFIQKQ
jgi:hypothetical protein